MDTVRVNLLSPESTRITPRKAGPTAAQRRQGIVVAAVLVVMLAVSGSRFLPGRQAVAPAVPEASPVAVTKTFLVDPVCKGRVDPDKAQYGIKIAGTTVFFEHQECAEAFQADPVRYAHVTNRVKWNPKQAPVATAPPAPAEPPSELSLPADSEVVPAPETVPAPEAPVAAPVTEPAPVPQSASGYPSGFSQVLPNSEPPAPAMQAPAPPGTKVPTLPAPTIGDQPTPDSDAPSVEEEPLKAEPMPLGMPKAHHKR